MKTITALFGLVLAAQLAAAGQDPKSTRSDKPSKEANVTAEVVAVDPASKTITVRSAETASPSTGTAAAQSDVLQSLTLPVQGKAVSMLKDVKAGDFVSLTCRADAAAGASIQQCSAVTAITKSLSTAATRSSRTSIDTTVGAPGPVSPGAPPLVGDGSISGGASGTMGNPSPILPNPGLPGTASGSIAQGGTINQDQSTVTPQRESRPGASASGTGSAEVKQRASQDTSKTTTTTTDSTTSAMSAKSAKMNAVVVSSDASAKTITVRNAAYSGKTASTTAGASDTLTLPVEGTAGTKLADFKAGDHVALTCRQSAAYGASGSGAGATTGSTEAAGGMTSAATQCAAVTEISKTKASTSDDGAEGPKKKNY
jgi:hypothetical protein